MSNGRLFGLDLVRAYAIVVVVHAHGYGYFAETISLPIFLLPAVDGVTVFFVLSGFLIGGILQGQTKEFLNFVSILDFWRRRWWRTLPTYYLVLSVLVGLEWWKGSPDWSDHFDYFLFLQNIAWPQPGFFSEAWSMPVEEWFYLLLPLIMFIHQEHYDKRGARWVENNSLLKNTLSKSPWLLPILAVIGACVTYRLIYVSVREVNTFIDWDQDLRKQVLPRLDSLMIGVLGAYVNKNYHKAWRQYANFGLVIAVILFLLDRCWLLLWPSQTYLNYWMLSLNPLMVLCCFPYITALKCRSKMLVRLVTYISMVSYPLYLIHGTIVRNIVTKEEISLLNLSPMMGGWFSYIVYWLISIFLAFVIHEVFEKPMTAMRDRHAS